MLAVVTSTSGAFLERPRKKAMAILSFDGVDDNVPAQIGEGIVLLALRRTRFDRFEPLLCQIEWTVSHEHALIYKTREGFEDELIGASACASTKRESITAWELICPEARVHGAIAISEMYRVESMHFARTNAPFVKGEAPYQEAGRLGCQRQEFE